MLALPNFVTGNLLVSRGTTLTVEPGVTVWISNSRVLNVEGGLVALGTAMQPITFTSWQVQGQRGDWGAISFSLSALGASFDAAGNYLGGSALRYSTVEYAGSYSYAVDGNTNAVYVDHSVIRYTPWQKEASDNQVSGLLFGT